MSEIFGNTLQNQLLFQKTLGFALFESVYVFNKSRRIFQNELPSNRCITYLLIASGIRYIGTAYFLQSKLQPYIFVSHTCYSSYHKNHTLHNTTTIALTRLSRPIFFSFIQMPITFLFAHRCGHSHDKPSQYYVPTMMHFFSELNYCENNPGLCQNGAKCVSLTKEDGNYRCLCREGTYGKNCEYSEYTTTTTSKTPVNVTVIVANTTVETTTTAIPTESGDVIKNPAENETN